MLNLLKIIFQAGEATAKYPFAPFPVAPDFRGKPELNAEQCIACGTCTVACPPNALTMATDTKEGTRTWLLDLGRCIFCGRCEEVCPTRAIFLTQEFELAVASKSDFLQKATFRLAACTCCNQYFAPEKEVRYAMDLLEQSGLPMGQEQRTQLMTCPDCKRKHTFSRDETSLQTRMKAPL